MAELKESLIMLIVGMTILLALEIGLWAVFRAELSRLRALRDKLERLQQ